MQNSTSQMLALSLAWLCLSGCSAAGLNLGFQTQKFSKESVDNPVEQVVPVWQESEGPGINQQQVSRGFSGQLYFITQARGLPSEVQGKVRVYLFDNQGSLEEQSKPIHQFDFEPAAWKAHLATSKLGPAYSVFIPYTRPGRNTAECALRIRYTPMVKGPQGLVEGTPVFSQMVTLTLGGTKKPADYDTVIAPDNDSDEVQPASKLRDNKLNLQPQLDSIQQVSAQDSELEGGIQTADFNSPATPSRSPGRVRMADFEEDATRPHERQPESTDAKIDFLGHPTGQPAKQSPSSRLKTYTIPLEG